MLVKNPLFSTALDRSSPSLSEHRISPPTPTPPPPTDYPNARILCIVGDRVDLAICAWELVNDDNGHDDDDDEDHDAAVAADMEDDERRRR